MNNINKQPTTLTDWKRLVGFPIIAVLMMGMIINGCDDDDDGPNGPDPGAAPVVTSTSPADNAENVPVGTTINATFNKSMDAATINESTFTLSDGSSNVDADVTYSANTATLTPTSDLTIDVEYTATITTGAESSDGVALEEDYTWSFTTGAEVDTTDTTGTMQDTIALGSTSRFAILARTAISDTDSSQITGDIGISPGTSSDITGFELTPDTTGEFATAPNVDGNIYASDYGDSTVLITAEEDLLAAYEDATDEVRGTADSLSGEVDGATLTAGLYQADALDLPDNAVVTLDGESDPNAVFIVRATSITIGAGAEIVLSGGAEPGNVYWIVESDVNVAENAIVNGTIITGGSVTMASGSELTGRLLLQGESATDVTLTGSIITIP